MRVSRFPWIDAGPARQHDHRPTVRAAVLRRPAIPTGQTKPRTSPAVWAGSGLAGAALRGPPPIERFVRRCADHLPDSPSAAPGWFGRTTSSAHQRRRARQRNRIARSVGELGDHAFLYYEFDNNLPNAPRNPLPISPMDPASAVRAGPTYYTADPLEHFSITLVHIRRR